jgi:NADH-quinone oxidoreductase subunit G
MIKVDGAWRQVDWQTALQFVADGITRVRNQHGADAISALATPHQTLEELYLLQKLARATGCNNIDFRTRQSAFSNDSNVPWLGMQIAEIGRLDRVLVVGSMLRNDHPLLAHRLRQAAKKDLQINLINPVDDELLMRVANKAIVAPSQIAHALAQVAKAVGELKGATVSSDIAAVEAGPAAARIAESLMSGQNVAILMGNLTQHHPAAAQIHAVVQTLGDLLGAKFGFLGEAANSVGGYLAGATGSGLNALEVMRQPRKAYVLLGVEPELDCFDPAQAMIAMKQAEFVVALSPYEHNALEYAHALLPVSPFTETSGTFVNTEGRVQSFRGVVQPLAETRPAWKVLRVLGNLLQVPGFDYDSSDAVLKEALGGVDIATRLNNRLSAPASTASAPSGRAIERIAGVSIYQSDAIVRRSAPLQKTRAGAAPVAAMNGALFARLELRDGDTVKITQGGGAAILPAVRDDKLPANCIRVPAGHPSTAGLGAMFGAVEVERIAAQQKVAV